MSLELPAWFKRRGPLFWNQVFLVAMAAIGQADFFRQMVFYTVECQIAALISVFFYSRSLGIGFDKFVEWLVATFMLAFFMLVIWAVMHSQTESHADMLEGLFKTLVFSIVFWSLQFGRAWYVARRSNDPAYTFFADALYPSSLLALLFTAFILFWFCQIANAVFHFQIEENSSFGLQRLMTTILVALGGVLRVAFANVWADPENTASEYRSFSIVDKRT